MRPETKKIRIAIVSDQHFHDPDPNSNAKGHSHIALTTLGLRHGQNPWADLEDLIEQSHIQVDMLLCPGDITTNAQGKCLSIAWDSLLRLGHSLGAGVVACATGNHDIRSRETPPPPIKSLLRDIDRTSGVFEDLKRLQPPYPLQTFTHTPNTATDRKKRAEYFGNDFLIHTANDIRLVILNSCAGHTNDPLTYDRGIVSEAALAELRLQLEESGGSEPMINILLCHHHPDVHSDNDTGTYDFILNGEALIQLLEEFGEWIIIHGHKHNPRIVNAQGTESCPITIFSAGSLGAVMNEGRLGKEDRNQFYVLELEFNDQTGLRGTLQVWHWFVGDKWTETAPAGNKISTGSGFGEHRRARALADIIAPLVKASGEMPWADIVAQTDFARYLFPRAVSRVLAELQRHHDISADKDPKTSALILGLK
jgi:hypothetical protein